MDGRQAHLERLRCNGRWGVDRQVAALIIVLVLFAARARAQNAPRIEIASDGGYSQLLVDGTPFFPQAATFDYPRIPRDLWESSLQEYRGLGINTLDLTIPWNWHETEPGVFDFDGHTNRRRDLQGLLKMATADGFCLIVRPGPAAENFWRNAGVPVWVTKENAAASQERWFEAVGRQLAFYQAARASVESAGGKEPSAAILFVEFGYDNSGQGSAFAQRRADWEAALARGGFRAPRVLTSLDAVRGLEGASGQDEQKEGGLAGLAGHWFFAPPEKLQDAPAGGAQLKPENLAALTLLSGALALQDEFPPVVAELAASGHAPADDSQAVASDPANLLIATRLLLGLGVRGMGYAPLQDTLTPAGWETSQANRYLRWDAALDLAGSMQPQAHSVIRNARLLRAWGTQLASAHLRADFGLVVRRAGPKAEPGSERAQTQMIEQIERLAQLAGLAPELLDLGEQARQKLLRDDVVFLPDEEQGEAEAPQLSDAEQSALVEYVRGGGTLVCFPREPAGDLLGALWEGSAGDFDAGPGATGKMWKAGEGRAIVVSNDFYTWVNPAETFEQNRAAPNAAESVGVLKRIIADSGGPPVIERETKSPEATDDLIVTQLVAGDPGDVATGRSSACGEQRLCAAALVSATNFSWEAAADEKLTIGLPTPGLRVTREDAQQLEVRIPARDSLLLPFHAPLCGAEAARTTACPDEVVAAGAELLAAQREGKSLELFFYAPERASIVLRLQKVPAHAEVEDLNLPFSWNQEAHRLQLTLPRGAAPDFLCLLKIDLPYVPAVREAPDPSKRPGRYSVSIASAVGLPLGNDISSLPSYPSLVLLNREDSGAIVLDASRHGPEGPALRAVMSGPVSGSRTVRLGDDESTLARIKLAPDTKNSGTNAAAQLPDSKDAPVRASDELPQGELRLRSGNTSWTLPLAFLASGRPSERTKGVNAEDAGEAEGQALRYKFDFDRDGSDEWVLENLQNRLVLSPADGGQVLAWVDKRSGRNLFNANGTLEDVVSAANGSAEGASEASAESYSAKWLDTDGQTSGIQLRRDFIEGGIGAEIEKSVKLTDGNTVEIAYRFALAGERNSATTRDGAEALTVLTSLPAASGEIRGTSFCWEVPEGGAEPTAANREGSLDGAAESRCEPFVPGGPEIKIPAGATRVEVRTPGQPGLDLVWDSGDLRIVPRNYSAQFRWRLPTATPGGEAVEASMRYIRTSER